MAGAVVLDPVVGPTQLAVERVEGVLHALREPRERDVERLDRHRSNGLELGRTW